MFWERYDALCRSIGLSANAVAKVIGCSSGSVTSWKKGKVPHHGTLLKIAKHFGVSVDYLLGKDTPAPEEEKSPAAGLNQQLAELWEQLDEAGQEEAMRYLEFLRSRRKG